MTRQLFRRTFIKNGVIAAGAFCPFGTTLLSPRMRPSEPSMTNEEGDPDIQSLLQVAIDAAVSAGASYVDCRFTHTKRRDILNITAARVGTNSNFSVNDYEDITVGVRALVAGYWGMSSSPIMSRDEMVRLAQESVFLATAGSATGTRNVVLAERTVVKNGTWTMPVQIDPFMVHPSEVIDRLGGLSVFGNNMPFTRVYGGAANFRVQTKGFLASDGCSFSQTTYLSSGNLSLQYEKERNGIISNVESLSPAGVGFELFDESRLREEIRQLREKLMEDITLPVNPVEPGRYTTLISAAGVAPILSSTIGAATEVDRVFGYEANATGTSYLKAPHEELGTFAVGNSLLNITADRTMPGGAATVKWDDEGVMPETFPLVEQGIVTDLQTNREGAEWIRDAYARTQASVQRAPVRSHGCAYAPSAVDPTMVHTANLRVRPSPGKASRTDLLASLNRGIFFSPLVPTLDFQQLSGFASSNWCYEIRKGKKVARLLNAGILFRTPEFWKSVQALGDEQSAQTIGVPASKGQPPQPSVHSVTAVPVIVADLSVIDIQRKA